MLKLIFRGFLEWAYELLVEMWEFIADGLLDIMGLDFAYLQSHIPIIPQMSQVIMAAGWALLLGNLVFQALKSMAAGLGFEGEDPKLLFARTFVFSFLLLASPQICRIGLDLTSNIMELLSVPDATQVTLVDESVFGSLTASWLMAIICSVIVMFKVLGLVIEIAERYVILAMLALTAPLAFAMGGSKNTASIFTGWCRMFGSMCLLMVTNLVCFKMLFSVLSTVPSGLDVLPWMVLIFAIVKVAKKSDAIITRIGLNPAITGGPGRTLLSTVVDTAVRTATSQVTKKVMGGGFTRTSSGAAKGSGFFSRFSGGSMGGRQNGPRPSGRAGGGYTYLSSNQQNASNQNSSQQAHSQQSSSQQGGTSRSAQQNSTRQENTPRAGAQQSANGGSVFHAASQTNMGGGQAQQTRRSSVPPGARRSPSYVPPSGTASAPSAPGTAGAGASHTANSPRPGAAGTAPASKPGTSRGPAPRPGMAGTAPRAAQAKQPNGVQPGAAGTAAHTQSARSTNNTSHTVGGGTVHSSSQVSGQTNVTVGQTASGAKAPPTTAPRQPHPGGSAVPNHVPKPGEARSTRREKGAAAPAAERPRSGTAPQEQRKSAAGAASQGKGGAPTIRPSSAGTATTGCRTASPGRTAPHQTKRAGAAQPPPTQRNGGKGHGRYQV